MFSADEYNVVIDNPKERKQKLRENGVKTSFKRTYIRGLYDTYKVIDNMVKLKKKNEKRKRKS